MEHILHEDLPGSEARASLVSAYLSRYPVFTSSYFVSLLEPILLPVTKSKSVYSFQKSGSYEKNLVTSAFIFHISYIMPNFFLKKCVFKKIMPRKRRLIVAMYYETDLRVFFNTRRPKYCRDALKTYKKPPFSFYTFLSQNIYLPTRTIYCLV